MEIVEEYFLIAFLICLSALFAGLTLGMMSLDKIGLEIVEHGDNPELAAYARKIAPVRADGNRLLCTLLLGNVCSNALLSIVMAGLTSGLVGFFVSAAIITVFGEIIPQAICSRHALKIGARTVPLVRVIIILFLPITFFLGKALDVMLGEEIGTIHTQKELRELMHIHVKHGAIDLETGREVEGALQYRARQVHEVMTPGDKVFMLHVSARLDFRTLSDIFRAGFSRIPVYDVDRNDIKGLILVKDLIFIDAEDETPVKSFVEIFGRGLQVVWHDQSLGEVLAAFKQGRSHMAIVRDVNSDGPGDPFYEFKGIITLEDIIETILGDEIVDETDTIVDMRRPDQLVQRENFDMSRLRLLNRDADLQELSLHEAQAVTAHLISNVPQFKSMPAPLVRDILAGSPLLDLVRTGPDPDERATVPPSPEDVLYRRGRPCNGAILVLNGRVAVLAGKDEFRSEMGAWTMLGADVLVDGAGVYKPDFTAFIVSEHVRCIQITRATYNACALAAASRLSEEPGGGGRGASSSPTAAQLPPLRHRPSPPGADSRRRNSCSAAELAGFRDDEEEEGRTRRGTADGEAPVTPSSDAGDDDTPLIASKAPARRGSSIGYLSSSGFSSSGLEMMATPDAPPPAMKRSNSRSDRFDRDGGGGGGDRGRGSIERNGDRNGSERNGTERNGGNGGRNGSDRNGERSSTSSTPPRDLQRRLSPTITEDETQGKWVHLI